MEFTEIALADVVNIKTGKLNSNAAVENGEYPFFTCAPLPLRIDKYKYEQKAILLAGNNADGNFHINYYGGKFEAYQRTYIIDSIDDTKINLKYIFYALKECLLEFKMKSQGTSTKFLTMSILNEFKVRVPNIETQNRIENVLSLIDEKITLNEHINNNLFQQIKALCSAYLTDFVPFGGIMPANWKTTPLSELANFTSGYSYKGNELKESNIAMATIKNFNRTGGFKLDGYKEIIPSSKIKETQHADLFDILVAHTDLTQNAEVIGNAEMLLSKSGYNDIVFSMDVVKVDPKNVSKFLLAAILQDSKFKSHCLGYVNGTTVLHLSKKALPDYELMLPSNLSVLDPLSICVETMYHQISNNIEEITKLTTLRDTLLPRLMSGEINVTDINI